jgi:exopolysaccharide biosynthesis polyprenyl glycosylphosphotransferase
MAQIFFRAHAGNLHILPASGPVCHAELEPATVIMISRKQELSLQINQIADGLILAGVLYLAYALRRYQIIDFDVLPEIPPLEGFLWMFIVVALFGPLLLEMQGFYQYPLEKSLRRSLRQIAYAGVWIGLILGACVVFLKLSIPSRSAFFLFILLAPVGLLLREAVYRDIRLRKLRRGEHGESIILAGAPEPMDALVASLTPVQRLEINVAERVDLTREPVSKLVEGMHRHSVGRVVLAFGEQKTDNLQPAIAACETEGVEAWVAADFVRAAIARPTYDALGATPMLVFRVTPDLSWALLVKTAMDRIGAFLGILLLLPFFLAIAAIIKLTSPGPVIFKQRRAGRHGRPFTMYKFRSMRTGAEMEQEELRAFNQMSGPVFKVENDPRITPFGRWLRKTSLDEFPQLFNVLFGQMSLVGPRPLPLYEVDNFELTAHRRRLSMKPGLTCLWQISGRNFVKDFNDWVKLDIQYIDNWSLGLDLSILLRTVPVVLFGKGAH